MDRNRVCKACDGSGLLADDENWRYTCTVCNGDGKVHMDARNTYTNPMAVDENNRTMR